MASAAEGLAGQAVVVQMTALNHGTRRTTAHFLYEGHINFSVLYRQVSRGALCAVVWAAANVPERGTAAEFIACQCCGGGRVISCPPKGARPVGYSHAHFR